MGKRSCLGLSIHITTQWGGKCTKCGISGWNVPVHGLLHIPTYLQKSRAVPTKHRHVNVFVHSS